MLLLSLTSVSCGRVYLVNMIGPCLVGVYIEHDWSVSLGLMSIYIPYDVLVWRQSWRQTDLDKRLDADKVKDPIVLITLGWILGMFLVATAFIVGGVN